MAKDIPTIQHLLTLVNELQTYTSRLALSRRDVADSNSRQEALYLIAKKTIGKDASPLDLANDELGCAESVSVLISKIIKFPIITGTWTMLERFKKDPLFDEVNHSLGRGTIIIAATGTGNGKIRGHVGILANNDNIMAANSADGIWKQFYTLNSWNKRWRDLGGFQAHYFKLK